MSVASGNWDELFDQVPALNEITGKGIDVMERLVSYAKERAAIELEYSGKLKGMSKKNYIKMKNENELWNAATYVKGYQDYISGLNPVAVQREIVAENLKNNVIPYATQKIAEYRVAKKQLEVDYTNLNKHLQSVIADMNKSHKDYTKAFKETEAAMLKYAKAEKNMEISRLELEKTKNNYMVKSGLLEEAKQVYLAACTKANVEQDLYYEKKLPQLLENYKQLHNNRILDTVEILTKCVEAEASVNSIIASCHNDMRKDIGAIDPDRDASLVVENMKTGHQRPPSFQFENLGHPQSFLTSGGSTEGIDATLKKGTLVGRNKDKGVARKQSMHQKFFGGSDKKDSDYGTLPPQQKARKLHGKISDLEKEKDRAVQSRDGVIKMRDAYRANTKLGDPAVCEAQIEEYGKEIDALCQQIQKLRVLLDDVNAQLGGGTLSATSVGGSDTPPSVRSVSSASSGVTSRVNTINDMHRNNGMEGGRRDSYSGSGGSDNDPTPGNNGNAKDEVYDELTPPQLPVLGEAIAQFAFDGGQEGTIRMEPNEKMLITERDEGDGWTRVKKENNTGDGFVPSSYLKITYFDKV